MAKFANGSAATVFMSGFSDHSKATFRMIPAEQIKRHPHNTAARNDTDESIRELADSIEVNGLIHPIVVNNVKGVCRLISGERRYRALTECLHETMIPSMEYFDLSPAMERLVLLDANLKAREYSAADKLALYIEAEQTLRDLKEAGEYEGGIQKGVAALLGVSERQIRNYRAAVDATGKDAVKTVKSITDAAATAALKKAEVTSAFLSDEDLLLVLKHIYNAAVVEQYYKENLPTPKDAIAFLKPRNGYEGGSRFPLADGRKITYSKSRNNIIVNVDGTQSIIKYPDAERVIRAAIAKGEWCEEADIAAKRSSDSWDTLEDAREDLIRQDIKDIAPARRPSAAFASKQQHCIVTADVLEPIVQAAGQFGVKIAESIYSLLPGDYDYLVVAIERIARDIRDLQYEFKLDATVVTQTVSDDDD